jgi:hypothetical protein
MLMGAPANVGVDPFPQADLMLLFNGFYNRAVRSRVLRPWFAEKPDISPVALRQGDEPWFRGLFAILPGGLYLDTYLFWARRELSPEPAFPDELFLAQSPVPPCTWEQNGCRNRHSTGMADTQIGRTQNEFGATWLMGVR